jgi:hypothetical protein
MTYLIDPKVFYWINVLDTLRTVMAVCAILGGLASITVWLMYWVYHEDEGKDYLKGQRITVLVVAVVGIVASVFIPNKETLIAMLVAKTATVENVGWSVDTLKEAVDYIVEAIAKIKG